MSESYTIGESPEDFKKFVDSIPITVKDTKAELLSQIIRELALLHETLGRIERAVTGGADG